MKMPWYSVTLFLFPCLEPLLRKNSWMRATSATVMITFSKVPFWILLNFTLCWKDLLNSYEAHWLCSILKVALELKILRMWINIHAKSFIKTWTLLSGLRQFLASESLLKMMKNVFYLTVKTFFVLKVFKFLSWRFGHV